MYGGCRQTDYSQSLYKVYNIFYGLKNHIQFGKIERKFRICNVFYLHDKIILRIVWKMSKVPHPYSLYFFIRELGVYNKIVYTASHNFTNTIHISSMER